MNLLRSLVTDITSGRLRSEIRGTDEIPLATGQVCGLPAHVADDLVVQAISPRWGILATRGYQLYGLREDGRGFRRLGSLPCPWNSALAGYSPAIRRWAARQDIVHVLPTHDGGLLVHSGGRIYKTDASLSAFRQVFRLRRWGPRQGRGILHYGWTQLRSGRILLGEYFNNQKREAVRLYASDDGGESWQVAREFRPGEVRHLHAVCEDPYTGDVWLCTGDHDHESHLLRSTDGGRTFETVGGGSQAWRTCSLVFTADHITWAADTESQVSVRKAYRLDRQTLQLETLVAMDGAVEFGLHCGELFAFATIRAGFGQVPDPHPSLWITDQSLKWMRIELPHPIRVSPRRPATVKMYADPSTGYLCLTLSNIERLDGKLALIRVDDLRRMYEQRCLQTTSVG